jgi:integrase
MAGKMTATQVRALVAKGAPARHSDGGNLYLAVTGAGAAKWTFRYMIAGKAREMGLGAFDDTTLAEARGKADTARAALRAGKDPVEARKAQAAAEARIANEAGERTFRRAADDLIADMAAGWRNPKHRAQWTATLTTYAYPALGSLPVGSIDAEAVVAVLRPIWERVPETGARLRGRIERVLDAARARGWRDGENPARWKGHLEHMLPKRSKLRAVVHHPALPWEQVPAFMTALRTEQGMAAAALEFAVLTAARTSEVRGMTWGEVDQDAKVWTVPGARMKAGAEHRVPLSSAALAVLQRVRIGVKVNPNELVFGGAKEGRPLSDMALSMLVRRMNEPAGGEPADAPPRWRDRHGEPIVPHGFRSSFRDWAEEATHTPRAVSEAALAHTIRDKVEAAYRRTDLFDKRRALMDEWAALCGEVAPAARAAA